MNSFLRHYSIIIRLRIDEKYINLNRLMENCRRNLSNDLRNYYY